MFNISNVILEDLPKYHSDLNLLFPVLEKINNDNCIIEISISLVTSCRICIIGGKYDKVKNILYDNNNGLNMIDPIYYAISEYVEYKKLKFNK